MSLYITSTYGGLFSRTSTKLSSLINKNQVTRTTASLLSTSKSDLRHPSRGLASHSGGNAVGRLAHNQKQDWSKAISEAETIVGYPTSFLSFRWLSSDDIATVAIQLRKLMGSNHPLLKTVKSLLFDSRNNTPAWSLVVLLFSKAAGHFQLDDAEEDKATGVLYSQRLLAEATEMIRTGHVIHKGLVNISPDSFPKPSDEDDMRSGNKISLLTGDYLLVNACKELSSLRNQDVMELMGAALRDLAASEFHGLRDDQNNPLPSLEGVSQATEDWTIRNFLSAGSLLGHSCQGTLVLAGHELELQEQGYKFGKHLALAWQARLDLEPFLPDSSLVPGEMFGLTSAPVMYHLEQDPSLFSEINKGMENVHNVDYATVLDVVSRGPGVDLTRRLLQEHTQIAMEALQGFQHSEAGTALSNIIVTMGDY